MVLAYDLIISTYGFWMPNEECGSWSTFVRSYELWRIGGDATKVETRRSVAGHRRDALRRERIRTTLARSPVILNGRQAIVVARGFADYCARTDCIILACSILPDHIHLVVKRHRVPIERVCEQLKGAATAELNRRNLHPFAGQPCASRRLPTPWARKGWWVYLDRDGDIARAVQYADANPMKAGLRPQCWPFVTRYV